MKNVWKYTALTMGLIIFLFLWFGVLIPYLINAPDDTVVFSGFVLYPIGALIALQWVYFVLKKPLVRLKEWFKENT